MINIFTALYCEAQPIIGYFGLKRQQDINRFQFFSNGTVNLLITGTGMLNAAVGVTSLCSAHRPGSGDILVNIGMVSGQLPVVGIPLPLISYGGTSMVTLMIGFGIVMSVNTHRRFLSD